MTLTYVVENITFLSKGSTIVGRLFIPDSFKEGSNIRPAITILGPFGNVKEHSPLQYGTRLAKEGYIVLIYDPRYSGESEGMPRRYESPSAKIEDIRCSVDFLETRKEINKNLIIGLAVCQGASEMLAAAAEDSRIKVIVLVSGQYLYPEIVSEFFRRAGGPSMDERIQRGKDARQKFLQTGTADYLPIVDSVRKDIAIPAEDAYNWYHKWEHNSSWENRYTVMSDAEVWTFNVNEFTKKIVIPTLLLHGEFSAGGLNSARKILNDITSITKELVEFPNVVQTMFYDEPIIVDQAVAKIVAWFNQIGLLKDVLIECK